MSRTHRTRLRRRFKVVRVNGAQYRDRLSSRTRRGYTRKDRRAEARAIREEMEDGN